MKIKKIILCFIYFNIIICANNNYKITSEQTKIIKQAKTLRQSGLVNESIELYYQLFNESPYLYEAFNPLKLLLKQKNDFKRLNR